MVRTVLVAVRAESYVYDRPYSYYLPASETRAVSAGMRALVPFGRGNRLVQALILSVRDEDTAEGKKPVGELLDEAPIISEKDLKLVLWMRDKYFCTCFDAFRLCIPAGSDIRQEVLYTYNREYDGKPLSEQSKALPLLLFIRERGGDVALAELSKRFGEDGLDDLLGELVKKKLLLSKQHALLHSQDKTVACARLADEAEPQKRLTKAQTAVVDFLRASGEAAVKEISYYTGASAATVKTLARRGLVELFDREVLRLSAPPPAAAELRPDPVLNAEQAAAYEPLCEKIAAKSPCAALLHGVTGSGKTLVYISLIRRCLRCGRQAVVLVPEIALTPQLLNLLYGYFGDRVAVLHSGLGAGERYDEWKRIRSGRADVVVGTRSAVFAPLSDIGLIVIDEEQEGSYKSEQSPRYHARDVAKFRAVQHGALLLLASATPALESMYAARSGKYAYFRLENRFGGVTLPEVSFADMKAELKRGNETHISAPLAAAIRETVDAGEQCILFLNRRGASRYMLCRSCGYVPRCEACSVALTYHSANHRLMCHYCSRSAPVYEYCPQCGSASISREGAGTQRIAEELAALFPGVGVIRMDADTTGGIHTHEALLERFRREKVPILLGTQMIAKGLDFDSVTLVGVIDGDQALNVPDFRANERAFSQLTQVVGRAGRGSRTGRAVIQTYSPDHEILRLAAAQDYDRFYAGEIAFRQALRYPPFCDLLCFRLAGIENSRVFAAARMLREAVAPFLCAEDTLYDPVPAPVFKLNNKYRYQVVLKTEESKRVRDMVSGVLRRCMADRRFTGIMISAEFNPQN
ncbi:MAG: primosomal protein N' [Clostridiales bacterium]|nr:MAG: primosomal protein N' [Clostridiales bacterium]